MNKSSSRRSVFGTAEMLDIQGFSPFLYAYLSFKSTRLYRKITENPAGHHSTEQRENVKTKLLVSQQNFSVS